jgi:serine/threonine protein kinase
MQAARSVVREKVDTSSRLRAEDDSSFTAAPARELATTEPAASRTPVNTHPTEPAIAEHDAHAWLRCPPNLGDYQIVEKLGEGGMGLVFKVFDTALNRSAALKVIPYLSAAGGEAMDRFFRAARLWAQLNHPSIAPIYHVGQVDGMPYVVSKLVDGVDLSILVSRSGGLGARDAARMIAEIADALHSAHSAGVIHRDVKPSNIMISPDGHATLVDFGLARSCNADVEASLTMEGQIIGTPVYMSPEQAHGLHDMIGPATDIYSLGATLYTLLAGQSPCRGETIMETLRQVAEVEPVSPRQLNSAIPRDLEKICLKSLAKRPEHRYSSAGAMALDLRRFLDGRPVAARAPGISMRFARRFSRRPAWVAFALLCLITLPLIGYQHFELSAARRLLNAARLNEVDRTLHARTDAKLRSSIELVKSHAQDEPPGRKVELALATAYCKLGDLLVDSDRLAHAASMYERAAAILRRNTGTGTADATAQLELADTLANLAEAYWAAGQTSEARAVYTEVLTIRKRLALDYSDVDSYNKDLKRAIDRRHNLFGATPVKTGTGAR